MRLRLWLAFGCACGRFPLVVGQQGPAGGQRAAARLQFGTAK
jgi:hypothetical protein